MVVYNASVFHFHYNVPLHAASCFVLSSALEYTEYTAVKLGYTERDKSSRDYYKAGQAYLNPTSQVRNQLHNTFPGNLSQQRLRSDSVSHLRSTEYSKARRAACRPANQLGTPPPRARGSRSCTTEHQQ